MVGGPAGVDQDPVGPLPPCPKGLDMATMADGISIFHGLPSMAILGPPPASH